MFGKVPIGGGHTQFICMYYSYNVLNLIPGFKVQLNAEVFNALFQCFVCLLDFEDS